MKRALIFITVACLLLCCGCSENKKDASAGSQKQTTSDVIEIPTIKSSDPVMPLYVDISIYDEEDYAAVYLGKDFRYNFTYGGKTLTLPSDYTLMKESGWVFSQKEQYNENSIVKAGQTLEALLENEHGKLLSATFYNESHASVKISACPLVKLSVKENNLFTEGSLYEQFGINGVTNHSVITDVIHILGAPSHFETFYQNQYRLSYFVSPDDRRNKITVEIDIANDCVTGIEVARYQK